MELEELRKIWNEQKGETMYAINESALRENILKKKNLASRRMNVVELSLMTINAVTGSILLWDSIVNKEGIWDYLFSIMILVTVIFLAFFRRNRLRQEKTFDRTMLGELDHTIANSDSIIRIATTMIYFYLLPLSIYSGIKMMVFGASVEKWLLVIGAFAVALVLVHYERKKYHIPRKERLIKLREKLAKN